MDKLWLFMMCAYAALMIALIVAVIRWFNRH